MDVYQLAISGMKLQSFRSCTALLSFAYGENTNFVGWSVHDSRKRVTSIKAP